MADIRIKDLTTTASTTAADDFFAADGATNGTRKLSAYSPTFGGNATVGGTLTVNGATINTSGTNSAVKSTDGAVITKVQSVVSAPIGIVGTESNHDLGVYTNNTNRLNVSAAGVISISGTTGSTTTSSGALTVGNGVSGGLGVGGAINAGGTISTFTGGVTRTSLNTDGTMFWGVSANLGVLTWDTNKARVGAQSTADFALTTGTSTDRLQISGSTGVITIPGTTASNSTSSGALVVSGGVGVAKEVYVGTALKLANTSQSVPAWGDVGTQLSVAGAVLTDTSSSGTVSRAVVNSIASSALAASSTTTYTQAATLFISNAPTANTNVTITHGYALYTAGGRINFQGLPTSSAGLQAGTLWNDAGTLKVA
jgi:hypothetical protein